MTEPKENEPQRLPALDYAVPSRRNARTHWLVIVLGVIGLLFLSAEIVSQFGYYQVSERANRNKCASNLKQIALGIFLYANDHAGQFPARLDQLMTDADCSPELFLCPASGDTKANGVTTQQILADFAKPGHCSYVYLGAGMSRKPLVGDTVIAYEDRAHHGGEGANVLYDDGHVNWMSAEEFKYLLMELKAGHNPARAAPLPTTQPPTSSK